MIVNLLFTVDVDQDGITTRNERTVLKWEGLAKIPRIKEVFNTYGIAVTWFVRADAQIKGYYDSASYVFKKHRDLWDNLHATGDEIGWHPHLYYRDQVKNMYLQETVGFKCAQQLRETCGDLAQNDISVSSVRIGEGFCCNEIVEELVRLGLHVDSTAIPGRIRSDQSRYFDWLPTPNEPYFPDKNDYRVPATASKGPLLEVPMTTIPIKAAYDPGFLPRYANLAYKCSIFSEGISRHFQDLQKQEKAESFLTVILHPDEICARKEEHPLYSFSLETVKSNIDSLFALLEKAGYRKRMLTTNEVPSKLPEQRGLN